MPAKSTVLNWALYDTGFRNQYVRARAMQAETFADELNELADDGRNDWMERVNDEGEVVGWVVNGEHIRRSKLRLDTRKWIAERILARKYGRKHQNDHTSSDGSLSPPTRIELVSIQANSDDRES